MKIAFRCDGNQQIGTGHVMRCISLARVLRQRGAAVTFFCRKTPQSLLEKISENNFSYIALAEVGDDASLFSGALPNEQDFVIVDHYELGAAWEGAAREKSKKICAIDDLANRTHDADILLDSGFMRVDEDYKNFVPRNCKLLLGTDYAILREDYALAHQQALKKQNNFDVPNIIINLGGSDPHHLTPVVLAALRMQQQQNFTLDVVLGSTATCESEVIDALKFFGERGRLLKNIDDMPQRLLRADVAIGAAGSSTWERCCCGVPTLNLVVADNQKYVAEKLEREGVIEIGAWPPDVSAAQLAPKIAAFLENKKALNSMRIKGLELIDGLGAARVADVLYSVAG